MNQVANTQTRQLSPARQFGVDIQRMKDGGELPLPSTVSFDAFKNAAMVALSDSPHLLSVDKASLYKSVRTLAAAGLVPDGREAAIVPFKGKAQAMPMIAGLIKVARNSGQIIQLWAEVVYEGEEINVWIEDGERKWDHVQSDGSRLNAMNRGGKIQGAYAVAKLKDGTTDFQPMSFAEIEKRRKASSNQRGPNPTGIWETWYEEMAKKTVIRNLCKRLPFSSEDAARLNVEEDTIRDITPDAPEPKKNLAQRLAEQAQAPEDTPHNEDGEIIDGEIMDDEVPGQKHWTKLVDTSDAFPGDEDFTAGAKAFSDGLPREDCPSDCASPASWLGGWDGAEGAVQ